MTQNEELLMLLKGRRYAMNNRILYINKRLKEIEEEAKTSSETMRIFLRQGYRLLLDEKRKLIEAAQKEEMQMKI